MPVVKIDDNEVLSINGLIEIRIKDFEYRINPNPATPWNNGENLRKICLEIKC